MLRSQSDFSVRSHPIDRSYRPFEPTKRVNRPFYDPELVNDMERVFSEYDWKKNRFTSTLRPTPQSQPASKMCSPCNSPSDSTVVSKDDRQTTCHDRVSSLPSRKQISRNAVDETLVSSYLLSSASAPSCEWEHHSPSSPIAQNDTQQSPLRQSILANAEIDREFRLPSSSNTHLKRPQEVQRQPRRVTVDEESFVRKETTPTGRTRSCTWSSDVTAVGVKDRQKAKSAAVEPEVESPRLWPVRTSENFWRSPRRSWRRRSLRRSHSAFARLDHFDQAEDSEFEEEAEDSPEENSERQQRENRLSSVISAIHYQYVSVGLRIQLAVHRTEKKVTRRLSDRRKSRHSDFL